MFNKLYKRIKRTIWILLNVRIMPMHIAINAKYEHNYKSIVDSFEDFIKDIEYIKVYSDNWGRTLLTAEEYLGVEFHITFFSHKKSKPFLMIKKTKNKLFMITFNNYRTAKTKTHNIKKIINCSLTKNNKVNNNNLYKLLNDKNCPYYIDVDELIDDLKTYVYHWI